jgi:RNA polymerase primary sigma factor
VPESLYADEPTTADAAQLSSDEIRGLLEEGREQGFLSGAHIATTLRDLEFSAEQLEELLAVLADLGIEIVEGEDAEGAPTEVTEEAIEEPPELDLSLKRPSSDALRVYLNGIGREPF